MAILNDENAIEAAMMSGLKDAIQAELTKKFKDEIETLLYEAVREVSERLRYRLTQEYNPLKNRNEIYLEWTFINKKETK